MTPGGVRAKLKTIAERAAVENVHPHRFRRTLATNLIGRGMPIQNVAVILGHDKLDTTMKYVYLDKADVRNSYKRYM
jgi:site-specific recombinase XerD